MARAFSQRARAQTDSLVEEIMYTYGTRDVCEVEAKERWGQFNDPTAPSRGDKTQHSRYLLNDLKLVPD